MCRLIHCLVDFDQHKRKFLTHHDSLDRLALDSRNSADSRVLSVWDVVADKWNDSTFTPTTDFFSEDHPYYHPTFSAPLELNHNLVARMAKATPSKCERKFASMLVVIKRVKAMFGRSGEGDNSRRDSEYDVDDDENASHAESDSDNEADAVPTNASGSRRMNFVKDKMSYILYVWFQLEQHDLMRSSLQELDSWVAALNAAGGAGRIYDSTVNVNDDNSSVRSSVSKSSRNESEFDIFSSSINNLGSSNLSIARMEAKEKEKDRAHSDAQQRTLALIEERKMHHQSKRELSKEISQLRKEKRQLLWQQGDRMNEKRSRNDDDIYDPLLKSIQASMDDIDQEIKEKQHELANLIAKEESMQSTPQKSNVTPNRN